MPIPTWSVGQVLAASDVNTWFVPLAAIKAADTSRASTTTVSSDPDLTLSAAASASYMFECYLDYEGGTGGSSDIKWTWAVPAGATLRYAVSGLSSGNSSLAGTTYVAGSTVTGRSQGAGNLCGVSMSGSFVVAATAGSLTLQWAQNTSSTTATIVHAQSYLLLRRIG